MAIGPHHPPIGIHRAIHAAIGKAGKGAVCAGPVVSPMCIS
jgi:hypothetical protein